MGRVPNRRSADVAAGRTSGRARTIVAAGLLAATLAAVAVIVFLPTPPDASGQERLAAWLAAVHRTWMPRWITFDLVEFTSNILMFLPLGVLGAIVFARAKWAVALACVLLSTGIELTQTALLPGRFGDWHDVLANTIGGALGVGIVALAARRRAARSAMHDEPAASPPLVVRGGPR